MSTILFVEARFYPHLNDMLLQGARRAIEARRMAIGTRAAPEAARAGKEAVVAQEVDTSAAPLASDSAS